MWPPWTSSPTASPRRAAPNPTFASSSLKDLAALLSDDPPFPSASGSGAARKTSVFHRVRVASAILRALHSSPPPPTSTAASPAAVVIYYTSLHVVRPTFAACRAARSILRSLRVAVDERDLAMDSTFLAELHSLLGHRRAARLPHVFIGSRYVGGADEIRDLYESGELKRRVEGAPAADAAGGGACGRCGGARFVLCPGCSGSHKRFSGKSGGFRTCNACNENGLARCPECMPSPAAAA